MHDPKEYLSAVCKNFLLLLFTLCSMSATAQDTEKQLASEYSSIVDFNRDKEDVIALLNHTRSRNWVKEQSKPFVFLQFGDIHGNATALKRALYALNHYEIECAVACGDLVSSKFVNPFDFWIENVLSSDKKVYSVVGNHDVEGAGSTHQAVHNKYYKPFEEKWGVQLNGKNYYHLDFEESKIRFIFLYDFDAPIQGNGDQHKRDYMFYGKEQLEWLRNTLYTTPIEYTILISKHIAPSLVSKHADIPYYTDINTVGHHMNIQKGSPVQKIVQHFTEGTHMPIETFEGTENYPDVVLQDFDFSSRGKGLFACYLSGHMHYDLVGYLRDFPAQLSITVDCAHPYSDGYSYMRRVAGTKSQDCMNVIGVNTFDGTISIIRLGANKALVNPSSFSQTEKIRPIEERKDIVIRYK